MQNEKASKLDAAALKPSSGGDENLSRSRSDRHARAKTPMRGCADSIEYVTYRGLVTRVWLRRADARVVLHGRRW